MLQQKTFCSFAIKLHRKIWIKNIVKRTICIEVDLPFKNGMLQLQITILRRVWYRSSLSQHTKLTILRRAF